MTLRLILIRHAKSAWDDPLLDDHDRTLNERGRRSARALGHWMESHGYLPDTAYCSTAKRTVETLDLVVAELSVRPVIDYLPQLYHGSAGTLLAVVNRAQAPTIAVIAHNPGIGDFASEIVRAAPAHPRFADYPTGATTVMDFDETSWSSVRPHSGTVVDFVVPRDLLDKAGED